MIKLGRIHIAVEHGVKLKPLGVILEVVHELQASGVSWQMCGERVERKLAEFLRQVQVQSVVSVVLPKRSQTLRLLNDEAAHSCLLQRCCGCKPRWSGSNYDDPIEVCSRLGIRSNNISFLHLVLQESKVLGPQLCP